MWPGPPTMWSYSSLREAEECPRRWALSRASYPDVWERAGFPQRPVVAALVGDIVHHALETVLTALHASGCGSRADASTVTVLRGLGGYSALVKHGIEEQLRRLEENPRMTGRIEGLASILDQRAPEMRQRVQSVVARMPLAPGATEGSSASGTGRGPLAPGSYPEQELRAPALRFFGRADVLAVRNDGVTITDYKTGEPDPHHADQLRTYAVLWHHDLEINPSGSLATTLAIVYAAHDEIIDGPQAAEIDDLAAKLDERVERARSDIVRLPPPARPSPDNCRYCGVRQMCEEYWAALEPATPVAGRSDLMFADLEGTVVGRNGPRSWRLALKAGGSEVLLRTPTEVAEFNSGDSVRLLGVAYALDDDAEQAIATITQGSEVFVVSR